ncbi:MAG: tetratricopeptide repeat protein [Saprospiraceae bacterium]|nr:MAG: lipoprotein NlpI [Bacteroidetes bacterium OLB9]MCO6463779.1 tetratricopeptide repeat protein [Saprospiraceae bacterium]
MKNLILFTIIFWSHGLLKSQSDFNSNEFYNQGMEYFRLKKYELAHAAFGTCLEYDQQNAKAWYFKAGCAMQMRNLNEAIDDYSKAITINPTLKEAYLYKGNAQLIKGDYQQAIQTLTVLINMDAGNKQAYNQRGSAYMKIEKYAEAIEDFNQAIIRGLHNYTVFFNRAICKQNDGDWHGALDDFNAAADIKPSEVAPSIEKTRLYAQNNQWPEVIAEASLAIKKAASKPELYYYRGFAKLMMEDLNGAAADFDICLGLDPKYEAARKNKALVSYNLKKFDQAIVEYTYLLSTDSKNEKLYLQRGICYLELGDYHRALSDFDDALKFNKNLPEAYFNRANVYTKLQEVGKACSDIKDAARLGYEPATAHINNICK